MTCATARRPPLVDGWHLMVYVLIVTTVYSCDDEASMRRLIEVWLEKEPGLTYVGGGPGDAGCLRRIASIRPTVVLLDWRLPHGLDGPDLVSSIRAAAPASAVVLYSGMDERILARAVQRGDADGYVPKGDASRLLELLRHPPLPA